jgi:hypothetical protein
LVLAAVLLLVPAAVVAGAALRVQHGNGESGYGTVVSVPSVATWWTFGAMSSVSVSGNLTVASGTVGLPSNLSGTASETLAVGSSFTGSAVSFAFYLTTSAPPSTEVELTFTTTVGGNTTAVKVFVLTPATAPASSLMERFDVASPVTTYGGFPVVGYAAVGAVCTSFGVCP